MKASLTWLVTLGALVSAVACDDGEQSLGENGQCMPMDARGDGQCDQGLGIVYNTDGGCIAIAGCDCIGDDCDQLFDTFDDCQDTCLAGQPCREGPETDVGYCPDNGFCDNGVCVYQ